MGENNINAVELIEDGDCVTPCQFTHPLLCELTFSQAFRPIPYRQELFQVSNKESFNKLINSLNNELFTKGNWWSGKMGDILILIEKNFFEEIVNFALSRFIAS